MSIIELSQNLDFKAISHKHIGKLIILIFHAQWNKSSLFIQQKIITTIPLFGQFQNVIFISVKAQTNPKIFKQFSIQYTPTILFVDSFKNIIKKYQQQDVSLIFDQLAFQSQNYRVYFQKQKVMWRQKIRKEFDGLDVVLLMEGNLQSIDRYQNTQFINLLNDKAISFTFINILQKKGYGQWISYFDGFQEYPQLYVKGKLIGSYSFCKQLHENGQLLTNFSRDTYKRSPNHIFQDLINDNKHLILVDGFIFEAKTNDEISKLSLKYVDLMIFNVTLCQGLKQILVDKYKSTFPMLFVQGKLTQY